LSWQQRPFLSHRVNTLLASQARQRRWMPMRANTRATASTMLPIASGKNTAARWKTLVASRFSMASKIARFRAFNERPLALLARGGRFLHDRTRKGNQVVPLGSDRRIIPRRRRARVAARCRTRDNSSIE
jgi:hypothetical protein